MSAQDPTLYLVEKVQDIVLAPLPVYRLGKDMDTVTVPLRLMRDLQEAYGEWLESRR